MGKVGIGVPTFNRSGYLRECLESLRSQRGDFTVLVADNASTDETPQIFDEIVGNDPRFSYLRRPTNIGALENFYSCLEMVDTEYFLWRADDDLSADNYVEALVEALDAEPDADLAVSPCVSEFPGRLDKIAAPELPPAGTVACAQVLLRNAQPTWIYGMWRRQALLRNVRVLAGNYNYVWASDHALMLPTYVTGRVTAVTTTHFHQRFLGNASYGLVPREQLRARAQYAAFAEKVLAEFADAQRIAELRSALKVHIDRNVGRVLKLRRRMLKRAFWRAVGRSQ